MRLLSLGLHAFGPFTESLLDFSGPERGGLHIIFGRNEAGKSTALRAVSGLLFGIAERSPDAHVHAARDLRLSACIEEGERRLSFQRRKRRKDSLRTPEDEPLAEAELLPFLHGVDAHLFHTLFGLDHERLKQGGQALLMGQGDIGESLFDAGTGGGGVHSVLGDLEREAEALFKLRASKPRLNAAVSEYKQSRKHARDEVRLPEKYLEQQTQLEQARQRQQELTRRRSELREREERLGRLLRTLTPVARRQQCLRELEALGEVPNLPEGTGERRAELERSLAESARDVARTEREIARRREQLEQLPPENALSELRKRDVDALRHQVGVHRKAALDLPKIRGQIRQAELEAQRILLRIGRSTDLDAAQSLRLDSARIAKIRRLARERAVLFEKHEGARERLREAEQQLSRERRELALLGAAAELLPLENALSGARTAGDLPEKIARAELNLREGVDACRDLRRRLFGDSCSDEVEACALPVPELETLEHFAARLTARRQAREAREAEVRQAEREIEEASRAIRVIEEQGLVPSEAELARVREERDLAFEALLATEEEAAVAASGVQSYRELVARSDALADRLRREAQRVAELAQRRAARQYWLARKAALEAACSLEKEREAALQSEWQALWREVPVRLLGDPAEMLSWRRRYDDFRARQRQLDQLERELQLLRARESALLHELSVQLGRSPAESPTDLGGLVSIAGDRLGRLREEARRRQALELGIAQLELLVEREQRNLEVTEPPLADWVRDWAEAVLPLGLGSAPGADEALAVLDELVELARKLDELPDKRRRVSGIERDRAAFESEIAPLLRDYAPDLEALPVDAAAEELALRHQEASRYAEARGRLYDELAELEQELAEHLEHRSHSEQELGQLLERVGARDTAELEAFEAHVRQARELRQRLRELDDRLLEEGKGASIEALVTEASSSDRATLVVELDEIKAELDDADTAWRDAQVTIVGLEQGLAYYSDERAATAAQQVEQRAAEARELLERYLKVRLAKTILEREIARYRDRHQGPVLSRASQLFQRLTLSRYQGLRQGLEERTLGCIRADGDEVRVAQLSEGTQYQLYLALRLATLEHYLEESAPIPLVFDDLLIHFDDERAEAAFGVLGELAERVQILYFTHLSRDLALSERSVDTRLLRQHRLAVSSLSGREPRPLPLLSG